MFLRLLKQAAVRDTVRSCCFESGSAYSGNRDWGNCTRCRLHHTRHRVAIKRTGGTGRTRLLFIGEAPGALENKTGLPFVGKAGTILNQLFKLTHFQFHYCITNVVGCRPVTVMWLDDKYENLFNEDIADPDSISHSQFIFSLKDYEEHEDYELYDWNREPTPGEIEACKPHVDEIVEDFNPDGIVYLGKVATSYKNPVKAVPIEKLDLTIHRRLKRINADFAEVPIPTLELYHPAYIARMEYKLLTLKQEARKLDNFVEKLLDS